MPEALLVEIGCEEIPSRMVSGLARQFGQRLDQHLSTAGLSSAAGVVEWTPRRLLYWQPAVLERQAEGSEQVLGPPVRVAVAKDGSFTPQAVGFAAKNGVGVSELSRVTTARGEYVALNRKTGGRYALSVLSEMIPQAFHEIDLPRSMAWGGELRFVRPVRWVVARLGSRAVPVDLGGLSGGTDSRGHRTLAARAGFAVATSGDFPALWRQNFVRTNPGERRTAILAAAARVLNPAGLRLRQDEALLDTLVNLTEYPDAILGSFEPAYIASLPDEVLVTVMRDHQKYFAVETAEGKLAPHFVAVVNQDGDPQGLIRHGNERVLRARFSDAQFFWKQDRKISLSDRLALLEQVTFQAKLGSYRHKSLRMRALAGWLAEQWTAAGQICDRATAETAAELAKCDLTTEMVKEFTELQGIMGGHYARAEGLPDAVAAAIADQYSWDRAPATVEGAVVSLADKLDTVVGMFAIGEVPTGSADPFALRRQANGVVRTLIEMNLPLSLGEACRQALAGYGRMESFRPPAEVAQDLAAFFAERLGFYLREVGGFSPAVVSAVLATGADRPLQALQRTRALAATPNVSAVAAVVKRARNIVRKENWTSTTVEPGRLAAPAEQALLHAVEGLPEAANDPAGYTAELQAIAGLAQPLEQFFNEVRVNDSDPDVRANRLSLLAWTVTRLSRIADFSELG